MSLRLQNALPYVVKTKISISSVEVGAPTTHFWAQWYSKALLEESWRCNRLRGDKGRYDYKMHFRLLSKQQIYINPVGTDVLGGPMSYRLKNELPYVAKQKIYIKPVGTGVLDCPNMQTVIYMLWSVIWIINENVFCNRNELGQSRTPVPTGLI